MKTYKKEQERTFRLTSVNRTLIDCIAVYKRVSSQFSAICLHNNVIAPVAMSYDVVKLNQNNVFVFSGSCVGRFTHTNPSSRIQYKLTHCEVTS